MKWAEREPYFILTQISLPSPRYSIKAGDPWGPWNLSMCHLCRYGEWYGGCCDDAELECTCGIERIEENCWDTWQGGDCWAFKPAFVYEDCVDAVGLLLNGLYPDFDSCRPAYKKRLKIPEVV